MPLSTPPWSDTRRRGVPDSSNYLHTALVRAAPPSFVKPRFAGGVKESGAGEGQSGERKEDGKEGGKEGRKEGRKEREGRKG